MAMSDSWWMGGTLRSTPGLVIPSRPPPRQKIDFVGEIIKTEGIEQAVLQCVCRGDVEALARIAAQHSLGAVMFWRHTNALHVAAGRNQVAIVTLLVQLGLNVNSVNENGSTPLHFACEQQADAACQVLVRMGAQVDAQDMYGNTPMIRGVLADNENAIPLMMRLGANPHVRNYSGKSALEMDDDRKRRQCSYVVHTTCSLPLRTLNFCTSCCARKREPGYQKVDEEPTIAVPIEMEDTGQDTESALPAEPFRLRTPNSLTIRGCSTPPIFGTVATIATIVTLILLIARAASGMTEETAEPDHTYTWAFGICYLLYWIEGIMWGVRHLKPKVIADRAFLMACSSIHASGRLMMKIECYHWVRHNETYTDKDGKTHHRHREEKRITHRAEQPLSFDEFWVALQPQSFPTFSGICFIKFSTDYEFADETTKSLVEQEKQVFIALNNRDEFYDFSIADDYPLPSGCVALDGGITSVSSIGPVVYYLCTLMMLSVPYRMWLRNISVKQRINLKRFLWKS